MPKRIEIMTYKLKNDFNWFGLIIPAGTMYIQHGADYWWPVIDDAHVPALQVDFRTVRNNPEWFNATMIEVNLFEGVFGYAKPMQPNTGTSYVHSFHTNEPLPEHLRDRIEKLIQEAINK
jgi:hypothetical protein